MSKSKNQILVQNVETFETINILTLGRTDSKETITQRVDTYLKKNLDVGIVSLDDDVDGEYAAVLLVAAAEGPDFMMDMATGEMEAVQAAVPMAPEADLLQEDIMMLSTTTQLAPVPVPVEDIVKPSKAAAPSGKKYDVLAAFIAANPGVSRPTVFSDAGLISALRTPAQAQAISSGDKLETKRWNRRLNFLIRDMRRGGVELQMERKGRVAHYTIAAGTGQFELPFTPAAEARNAAIIGNDDGIDVIEVLEQRKAKKQDAKRLEEAANQNLSFESLLSQLDDDEATVTSDDQVAFKAAREMLK